MSKQNQKQFTLADFCREFPQDRTTGELKREKAKLEKAFKKKQRALQQKVQEKPMPMPKAVWVKKEKKEEEKPAFNVHVKEFVPQPVVDLHSAYVQAASAYLPYVVPANFQWKQAAGDAMYNWVFMIHGKQSGHVVGAILDHCSILEVRMMLQDFNLLILRSNQAKKQLEQLFEKSNAVVQKQTETAKLAKLSTVHEDDSEHAADETADSDLSFVQETPKERLDCFFNNLSK